MQNLTKQSGFTLVELMITVAIIGVLSAIAIVGYDGYISTAKQGTAMTNAKTLAGFEETYFYENDAYLAGTYDGTAPTTTLPNALSWNPQGDANQFIYTVAACGSGTIATCYDITVTYAADPAITVTITRTP